MDEDDRCFISRLLREGRFQGDADLLGSAPGWKRTLARGSNEPLNR